MKHLYKVLPAILLSFLVMQGCKKDNVVKPVFVPITDTDNTIYKAPSDFRVIGYIYEDDIEGNAANGFDISRVNYINVAFINPGSDGKFANLDGLKDFISKAHGKGVKVMASICGGDAPSYFKKLLVPAKRDAFVDNLVQLTADYGFDGIDVDIEDVVIDSNYEPFVISLSAALKAKNKLITAAVGTYESDQLSDKALAVYDFLNVMSYDATGPWDPTEPGPHSPYSMAVSDLDFWTNIRGIAKEKLNLGLPFYGYEFGKNSAESVDYVDIIKQYPNAENQDQLTTNSGSTIYYNGIPTIEEKTKLAMQKSGGIMLWELGADASGNKSLLNAADKTANPTNK